jgi:hypothetical protein
MTKGVQRDLCKKPLLLDIRNLDPWKFPSLHPRKKVEDASLLTISNEVRHSPDLCKGIGLHLSVTSGHDEERTGAGP